MGREIERANRNECVLVVFVPLNKKKTDYSVTDATDSVLSPNTEAEHWHDICISA
jgi:hypothetical protein